MSTTIQSLSNISKLWKKKAAENQSTVEIQQ